MPRHSDSLGPGDYLPDTRIGDNTSTTHQHSIITVAITSADFLQAGSQDEPRWNQAGLIFNPSTALAFGIRFLFLKRNKAGPGLYP